MRANAKFVFLIFALVDQCLRVDSNLQNDIIHKLKEENSTTLLRKRRYLVFPEGSSFQVVYDLTYPSVAIQGNVFTFGHTAAMAWELPSTPIFLDNKKMKKEEKEETTTMNPIPEHLDHDDSWKPPMAWDYHELSESTGWQNDHDRPPIMYQMDSFERYHPQHFGYDRVDSYRPNFYKENPSTFWSHRTNFGRSLFQTTSTEQSLAYQTRQINRTVAHYIQRRSRRELYNKIEKLLSALSKDGKSCVLKAICQVKKLPSRKGTFWEEIVKAIFRAKHDVYPDEDHYDKAANIGHDCDKMYPNCDGHVLSNLFRNRIRK